MERNDTIVAISTGASVGAIAIVRMSGKDAINIADKIFLALNGESPSNFHARMLMLGTAKTKGFSEQAMCVVFKAPNSYTGEDLVEFQCHGGQEISKGICAECVALGARPAVAGEFSKRAFLNGKMSLSATEGIANMIEAESEAEVRAGYNLLSGKLGKLAIEAQEELTDILAEIEVSFDYPEETIEYITKSDVRKRLENLQQKIQDVLATANTGRLIKNGINVLIIGKPNVGKSSLLNALLGSERAIVTDVAGTTRDTIEGTLTLDGIKINLTDTAGIHETEDIIEKIGVDKAKNLLSTADIILFLIDISVPLSEEDKKIYDLIKDKKHIVVKNKCDLKTVVKENFDEEILVSSHTQEGLNELRQKILKITEISKIPQNSLIITNERHKNALFEASKAIKFALDGLKENSLDLISVDIKQAYLSIGEITGNTASEEIIDQIFKKFCLGK